MATPRPAVHVVATGGSIAGLGPHRLDYILYPELGQRLSIEEMLARIPEAHDIAEIQAENLIRVGSPSIGPPEWLQLAQRINALFSSAHPPPGHSSHAWHSHPGRDRLFSPSHRQIRAPGRGHRGHATAHSRGHGC